MKKIFQCVNSNQQLRQTCSWAWKPYMTTIEPTITVSYCGKPKGFLKIPFYRKLASKRCFITCDFEWFFDEQVSVSSKLHFRNNQNSAQEAKNQISFWNSCSFKSTAIFNLRNHSTFDDHSERTQVRYSKLS